MIKANEVSKFTNQELDAAMVRLRKENEVRCLIENVYNQAIKLPPTADKSKTIKGATDEELNALVYRLRRESELQSLIGDLKRKGTDGDVVRYDAPGVSTEEPIENLYHFGIPGMKWGVRRARGPSGRVQGSADYRTSRALKKKGSKNLSTEDLQKLTKRLQLEKQFSELNPTKYKKGMAIVKGITAAGTTVASLYALSKTPLAKDVMSTLKKKVG
jgi:hypothetical protein